MKKNTYPVAVNAQAEAYRNIFKDDSKPGRVKGINNSPNLVALFPNSPFNEKESHNVLLSNLTDRGRLLFNLSEPTAAVLDNQKKLTNEVIGEMFATVVDGSQKYNNDGGDFMAGDIRNPHIKTQDTAGNNNYNWLYRDQKMDMNFNYLIDNQKSSPDPEIAPVGSNAPITGSNVPKDKPFWGHANLNVPSIDWNETRTDHDGKPQLQRGSGGFGSSFSISNRAFAAQEQIGQYFTNSYVNVVNAGGVGTEEDRLSIDRFGGKSIKDRGAISEKSADYQGDVDKDGNPV